MPPGFSSLLDAGALSPLRAVLDLLGLADLLAARGTCQGLRRACTQTGAVLRALAGVREDLDGVIKGLAANPVVAEGWLCELAAALSPEGAPMVMPEACAWGRLGLARQLYARLPLGGRARVVAAGLALVGASARGRLDVVPWLWGELCGFDARPRVSHGPGDATAAGIKALTPALCGGHLEVARWLWTQTGEAREEFAADSHRALGAGVFARVCAEGDARAAREAAELLGVAPDARADQTNGTDGALSSACDAGRLETAQWIWEGLPPQVRPRWLKRSARACFDGACHRGHLAVARWVYGLNGFMIDPSWPRESSALHRACVVGDLDAGRWLMSVGFTVDDARRAVDLDRYEYDCVGFACMGGHLDIVEWLWSVGIGPEDLRESKTNDRTPFELACVNDHIEVAQWLWSQTGGDPFRARDLDADDCAVWYGGSLIRDVLLGPDGARRGVPGTARWLWTVRPNLDDLRGLDTNDMTAIEAAVRDRDLERAQWLWSRGLTLAGDFVLRGVGEDSGEAPATLLVVACEAGDLSIVEWIGSLGLTLGDARTRGTGLSAFAAAAARGNLGTLAYLWGRVWLPRGDSEPAGRLGAGDLCEALGAACGAGEFAGVRWLWQCGGLSLADVYGEEPAATGTPFWLACRRGSLEVARWLWAQIGEAPIWALRPDDDHAAIRATLLPAFAAACRRGHLEVAQWLWSLGLTLADVRGWAVTGAPAEAASDEDGHRSIFADACAKGREELARWLWGLGLGAGECDAAPFAIACARGQAAFARWYWGAWVGAGRPSPEALRVAARALARGRAKCGAWGRAFGGAPGFEAWLSGICAAGQH